MAKWSFTRTANEGGRFQIIVTKLTAGGQTVDVTTFRGSPTVLNSFSSSDPFGDSTAVLTFPSITVFDDPDSPELATWLDYYANVDIYWVPALREGDRYRGEELVFDALTGLPDAITPASLRASDGTIIGDNRVKVFEGFLAAMGYTDGSQGSNLQVQCQGALFQLDHYLQKPFYPTNPWPLERLISDCFDHTLKPHLRTQPLQIFFPTAWTKHAPSYSAETANVYTPVVPPGALWSGYTSRNTGAWEHTLTDFIQNQLSLMITDNVSGVTPGNQWTVQHVRQSSSAPLGRQPTLQIRDRLRAPDFAMWVGTPGLDVDLSGDSTQSENIIYGSGTDIDGAGWRNAVVSSDGSRTDYLPLAASRNIFPANNNQAFNRGAFASEAFLKFDTGFSQTDATTVAEQNLARDQQPGFTGTLTLTVDPSQDLSRWLIRAGMTILLQGFQGTGERGMPFHIAAVEADVSESSVQLTVDTRYRDLLTVAEAIERNRDPLNPVKMLQVGKASVMIDDLQAPWDYSAGSGYVPTAGKPFYDYKPTTSLFPYTDWSTKHPPLTYPSWYVKCNANSSNPQLRWAGPVPILASEKDAIARSEFFVTDIYGNVLKIPFHVSLYYINVTAQAMPRDAHGGGPSPYLNDAFEKVDPITGVNTTPLLWPANGFIIGWGNRAGGVFNRAGFSPGSEAAGANPTGLLEDDAGWNFDMTTWRQYFQAANPPGAKPARSDISLYAMFYAEYSTPVYFQGRLFRQNPGSQGS